MAGDDHQQHAERHDDDVAVLQDEIGEVERLQQRAVGHDLEEQHDREQRQQHAVVAQIVLDEPAMPAFPGKRNRLVGHGCTAPIGTSFARVPFLTFRLRMMARMMFSCVASAAANSPTKAPSFIT